MLSQTSLQHVGESLIRPALKRVGYGWEHGEISVAQEYRATGIVAGLLGFSGELS